MSSVNAAPDAGERSVAPDIASEYHEIPSAEPTP